MRLPLSWFLKIQLKYVISNRNVYRILSAILTKVWRNLFIVLNNQSKKNLNWNSLLDNNMPIEKKNYSVQDFFILHFVKIWKASRNNPVGWIWVNLIKCRGTTIYNIRMYSLSTGFQNTYFSNSGSKTCQGPCGEINSKILLFHDCILVFS